MTVTFLVTGHVQGVGFRAHVRYSAEGLGLVGEVWNRRDGSVEGWAAGAPEALSMFETKLREGPGRVDGVATAPSPERAADRFTVGPTQ
ncbi:MAG: acylphosphatase [Armatimonadetes bacterium]|nr:acylphosphatase [Armatimonadota bacterium]